MNPVPRGAWATVESVPEPWAKKEAGYIAAALAEGKVVAVRATYYPEIATYLAQVHKGIKVRVEQVDGTYYMRLDEGENK